MIYAKCHPDRKHRAKGKCGACYQRDKYRARRAQGLPAWLAALRSPQGWANRPAIVDRYRKKNHAWWRDMANRHWRERKRLYGGNPSRDMLARIRWLNAKNAAGSPNPAGAGAQSAATRSCEVRKLRKLDPHDVQTTPKRPRPKRGANHKAIRRLRKGDKKAARECS